MYISTTLAIGAVKDIKVLNMLFILLKLKSMNTNGRIVIPPTMSRAERRNFKELIKRNWCSQDERYYFMRSFDRVRKSMHLKAGVKVKLKSQHFSSKNGFKAFLTACVFLSIERSQRHRKKRPLALQNWKGNTTGPALPKINYPNAISIRYFAKYVGISTGKATLLKKLAQKHEMIIVKLKINNFEYSVNQKLISPDKNQLEGVLLDYPEFRGRIFLKRGQLFYRQPDQIFSLLN
jgi:hypothetical protein